MRKQLNMTQEQLAQRLGIGKAALSMIETGKARLSARNRNILVQDFNANPDWLETGAGKMFNAEPNLTPLNIHSDRALPLQSVPLYSIEGTAGLVPLFAEEKEFEPVNYIHIPNLPKCDGAIYVVGDSMYPLLKSGDIILCHNNGYKIETYLPVLIKTAQQKGFSFVTVSELLLSGETSIDNNGIQQARKRP